MDVQCMELVLRESFLRRYKLSVTKLEEEIFIRGIVDSFYHKQIAQEAIIRLMKGKSYQGLTNEIEVKNGN